MGECILELKNISKDFPGVKALKEVSFSVRWGEVHSICGENGAGKSTLIKILSGIYPTGSYEGTVLFDGKSFNVRDVKEAGRLGVSTIFQELTLFKKLTIQENLFVGDWPRKSGIVDWRKVREDTKLMLDEVGLEVDPSTIVEDLGIGQQQLVEIAKALRKDTKLLILDEPTSALSESEVGILMKIIRGLRARGVTCIYISHKLDEVFSISDTITVLRDGQFITSVEASKINRDDLIMKMVGRELKNIFPRVEQKRGDLIVEVKNWNVYHNKLKRRKIIDNINLSIFSGEILGVAGLMGSGRTEFASSIFGLYEGKTDGELFLDGKATTIRNPNEAIRHGIAYLPEDRKRHGLVLNMGIASNITLASLGKLYNLVINRKVEAGCASESIDKLQIKAPSFNTVVNNLSGGNQQKVVIGKWLTTNPRVLFLDEVTRGVDVGAKHEIYRIINDLVKSGIAIVMISSELPELIGICNRIIVIHEGKLKGEFVGSEATQEQLMTCAMSVR